MLIESDGTFEECTTPCPMCNSSEIIKYIRNGPHIEARCGFCDCHIKYVHKYKDTDWAKRVKERDMYKCQRCGELLVGRQAHAHHKMPAWFMPELRFDMDNGICLCNKCHKQLHGLGGTINKNRED